jgi:hypothetical protein
VLVGLVVTAGVWEIDTISIGSGARGAVALLLWYGVRGIAGNAVVRPRRLAPILEYMLVVAVAVAGLYWVAR